MPCSGCVSYLAQHTGGVIKYWCEADQSYHYDWEPCVSVSGPGSSSEPLAPTEPFPTNGQSPEMASPSMSAGRDCGCCGNGKSVSALGTTAPNRFGARVLLAAPCSCGYSKREAFLAAVVAFVVFFLLRE